MINYYRETLFYFQTNRVSVSLKLLSICILITNLGYIMGTSDFNGLVDIPECLVGLDLNIRTRYGLLHPVSTRAIWGDCIWEWFYWKTKGCFSWNRKQNQRGFLNTKASSYSQNSQEFIVHIFNVFLLLFAFLPHSTGCHCNLFHRFPKLSEQFTLVVQIMSF